MTDLFEITEPAQVEALAPFYCFSTQYAEERLRWKPRHPLLVMADPGVPPGAAASTLPNGPELGGCKSWLTLDQDVDAGQPDGRHRRRDVRRPHREPSARRSSRVPAGTA